MFVGQRAVTRSPARNRLLLLIFGFESFAFALVQTPSVMRFRLFTCTDIGANLTLQNMLARDLRPQVDFGYPYGLLPVFVGRLLYKGFGYSPTWIHLTLIACAVTIAVAAARIALDLNLPSFALGLLAVGIPFAARASYPNLAHALEAAILASALACQLGSRRFALMLCTAAAFSKPSMAYLYGFLIIVFEFRQLASSGHLAARPLVRFLLPAVILGSALSFLFALEFGIVPLLRTLLPTLGASAYRANHFGFFGGIGKQVVYFSGVHPGYYLGTYAGFWIVGSIWLLCAAIISLFNNLERGCSEIILTCAVLNTIFICFFFGPPSSWVYYSYIVLIGLIAATSVPGSISLATAIVLAGFAVISDAEILRTSWLDYRSSISNGNTAGLYATRAEEEEWTRVLALVGRQSATFVSYAGAGALTTSQFSPPVVLFLMPGYPLPQELQREEAQLASARSIVVCRQYSGNDEMESFSELAGRLTSRDLIFSGKNFEVFQAAGFRESGNK